jgi:XTP/dITP diphosphohydrolase
MIKARHYAGRTGLATVAEDSGLVVDALGGRPGVESARYPGRTYPEKFANLYRELSAHPRPWSARFVCSLAVVDPVGDSGEVRVLFRHEAAVEGEIAPASRGSGGFGYDPIFFYPPYARTLGEVSDRQKLAVSHRGQAFRELRAWIEATAPGSPRTSVAR